MAHWGMEDVQACFGDTADLNTRQITVGGQRLGLLFLDGLTSGGDIAEQVLKPLMEIAKKSNTQLVCLSGLGGDSIYNRFDNIYVLNLISSKLRGGVQFLHGEHLKGEEAEEVMEASQFKITEEIDQMDLF